MEELLSASGNMRALNASMAAATGLEDANSDDDEWEDEPGLLDLSRSAVKEGSCLEYPSLKAYIATFLFYRLSANVC